MVSLSASAEVSDKIRQCINEHFQKERQAIVDLRAARDLCILAGSALELAIPLCSDVRIEINNWHPGESTFELQKTYIVSAVLIQQKCQTVPEERNV